MMDKEGVVYLHIMEYCSAMTSSKKSNYNFDWNAIIFVDQFGDH